jgi:AcrR family transcriptional regulator
VGKVTTGRRRLAASDRREQLLDSVARQILAEGLDAVTMDSAAVAAGVSKALVYRHFADRDDLLVAVLSREIERLRRSTEAAVREAADFRGEMGAALPVFFEVGARGSGLLETLVHTTHLGRPLRRLRRAYVDASEEHWARRAAEVFGLPRRSSLIAAAVFLGGLGGLGDFMRRRRIPRAEVERVFAELVEGGLEGMARGRGGPARGA